MNWVETLYLRFLLFLVIQMQAPGEFLLLQWFVKNVIVDYDCSQIGLLLLSTLLCLLFFLDNCSEPFVSKYVIVSSFGTFFALCWLGFLVLNTEIIVFKIVIFVFLDFLDETHIDKILDLLLMVLSPFVKTIILLLIIIFVRYRDFHFHYSASPRFLDGSDGICLTKLLFVSFQLFLSQLLDHAYFFISPFQQHSVHVLCYKN